MSFVPRSASAFNPPQPEPEAVDGGLVTGVDTGGGGGGGKGVKPGGMEPARIINWSCNEGKEPRAVNGSLNLSMPGGPGGLVKLPNRFIAGWAFNPDKGWKGDAPGKPVYGPRGGTEGDRA